MKETEGNNDHQCFGKVSGRGAGGRGSSSTAGKDGARVLRTMAERRLNQPQELSLQTPLWTTPGSTEFRRVVCHCVDSRTVLSQILMNLK